MAVLGSGSWAPTVASIVARSAPTTIGPARPRSPRRSTSHTPTGSTSATSCSTPPAGDRRARSGDGGRRRRHHGRPLARLPAGARRRSAVRAALDPGREHSSRDSSRAPTSGCRQIVAEVLPGSPGLLAGPNIAKEVANGYAAAATIAMPDQNSAGQLAELFRTSRFRIYSTTDVIGVEIAGALKNVYAHRRRDVGRCRSRVRSQGHGDDPRAPELNAARRGPRRRP